MATDTFPDYPQPKRRKSILDPYVGYLQQRWDAGCHDSRQLWREIRQRGFPGSTRMVWLWVTLRRERLGSGRPVARQVQVFTPPRPIPPVASASFSLPAARRLSWLLVLPQSSLDEDQQRLQLYLRQFPELEAAFTFTQQFLTIVHHHRSLELQPWIDTCSTSGLPELASFAQALQRDLPIIQPALELPYSNGVAEGHINRLKTIKRSMYGRANFDLLRLRVLAAA